MWSSRRWIDSSELPQFMWFNELPVGSASQFAQWCVFQLAKQHGVTVLLDGQGADEVLGGYEHDFGLYVQALEEPGEGARLAREKPMIGRAIRALAIGKVCRTACPFGCATFCRTVLASARASLRSASRGGDRHGAKTPSAKVRVPCLGEGVGKDSFGRYLTTLLRYGDRNSMAHSREVRLPFCDHRIRRVGLRCRRTC